MPTLITPLVNGFSDAANGTVEFYSRGTASLSSLVYSDPDGLYAVTDHDLDADGRIIRYTNEIVDVVVRDSTGVQVVPTWTAMTDARSVRVENSLFTGPNTNGNGQVVAGGRTTLHSGLTLLRTSLGATDGVVAWDDGSTYLLQTAVRYGIRQGRYIATTVAGTSYTPNAYQYHTHIVTHASGASMAFANPDPDYALYAARLLIVYVNNTGGNRTPTWGTSYSGAPATAVATATTALYPYERVTVNGGGYEWVLDTTTPVTAAS